ncbi:MAG: DUF4124 domain-containing protein, partial [Pseudoxanthomonas sp.]
MKAACVPAACCFGLALMLLTVADADAARLYRWKDRHGVTQYGDQPPEADELPATDVNVTRFRN